MVGPSEASTGRLLVLEVKFEESWTVLRTVDLRGRERIVFLCEEWRESTVLCGNFVRVILTQQDGRYISASTLPPGPVSISRNKNILIIHPDTLVSSTHVADSFLCLRKAVLGGRVPQGSLTNSAVSEAALFGSMIHALFQKVIALDSNKKRGQPTQSASVEIEEMFEAVEDVLAAHLEDLYGASISDRYARRVLHKVIPEVLQWYNDFMGAGDPCAAVGVDIKDASGLQNYVISDVLDIEELIWSPVFGLKGKIDATVKLRRDHRDAGVGLLELKTGSSTGYSGVAHAAQVSLYNLMLSDRYDRHIGNGLLSYIRYQKALQDVLREDGNSHSQAESIELTQTKAVFESGPKHRSVTSRREELLGLIMQRNKLAGFLRLGASIEDLPPPIQDRQAICAKCYANDSCLVQYKLLENGTEKSAENGPGTELFTQKVAQLTPTHASYYRFWREALTEEERHSSRFRNEIWAMRGARRESEKRCLANLILAPGTANGADHTQDVLAPGDHLLAEFQRHSRSTLHGDFTTCGISTGDFVVISAESVFSEMRSGRGKPSSTETWQSGLTNGFVRHVSPTSVSVVVDRSLASWAEHQGIDVESIFWRVDAEEIYASHSTAKRSLESLFISDETENTDRLRALIVDKKEPEFNDLGFSNRSRTTLVQNLLHKYRLSLNDEQKKALHLSLSAKDYVLVLGMPGTGKTTTLAAVILASAMDGKSVLFCSHTNAAVDNMLCKLLDVGFTDFIRLGRKLKVIDQRIHPYHISMKCTSGLTLDQLEKALGEPRVVATTCLGINHPIFARRGKFDLVVVDEASQILQPICLGPVLFSQGPFVLVGDHYQLPPITRRASSKEKYTGKRPRLAPKIESVSSADESLFRRLAGLHPIATVNLSKQYRMAGEVMGLSNELIYSGSLRCGTEQVAAQKLKVSLNGLRSLSPWLKAVRNPSRRLVFLDMDPQEGAVVAPVTEVHLNGTTREHQNDQSGRESAREAHAVVAATTALLEGGLNFEDISILSPFRAQKYLIKELLAESHKNTEVENLEGVRVFTVDEYQGKENSCVILSFVRSNGRQVGPLLADWRRLNVALTRAKQKLVVVGSANTLSKGSETLRCMIEYVKRRNLIFPVELE